MNRIFVLGPGQGAQALGMGRAWVAHSDAARAVMNEADRLLEGELGEPLSAIMFEGPPERLNRTDVSQPAIFACSIACWQGLRARYPEFAKPGSLAGAAGLSLGEYTALCIAGVFEFAAGLRMVAARGRLMQEAAEQSRGGMVAIIGGDDAAAEALARDAAESEVLVCANYNAPGQVVLSGAAAACDRAVALAEARGLRATRLAVAGAFHSALMQPAADRMAAVLADVEFARPTVPVWSNVLGRPHDCGDGELMRRRLVEQIVQPVRWSQGCALMPPAGSVEYHELAPGSTLRGLMRRIDRERKVTSHDQPAESAEPAGSGTS
ncbi:MAG: ACP S-malonyltransferase [Phycisphaeraceae bacterium]|nr:ACP S-malonyltransferase [Phycisphaeraceae bacterium]